MLISIVSPELFCVPRTFPQNFKRIAMRACKTDQSFEALINLCSAVINSR